jgi:apolipoprotein D and lipocalin family protein
LSKNNFLVIKTLIIFSLDSQNGYHKLGETHSEGEMNSRKKITLGMMIFALMLASLAYSRTAPKNAIPVSGFDVFRYLGKWYEIARLDFKHEKNMSNVTAEYILKDDGSIMVVNRGYDFVKGTWKESVGNAKFIGDPTIGALKVSFFGPFYSGYNVIAIDDDYQTALVVGKNYDYMWILSRTNTIPDDTKIQYLAMASNLGFDVNKLVWDEQGAIDATAVFILEKN